MPYADFFNKLRSIYNNLTPSTGQNGGEGGDAPGFRLFNMTYRVCGWQVATRNNERGVNFIVNQGHFSDCFARLCHACFPDNDGLDKILVAAMNDHTTHDIGNNYFIRFEPRNNTFQGKLGLAVQDATALHLFSAFVTLYDLISPKLPEIFAGINIDSSLLKRANIPPPPPPPPPPPLPKDEIAMNIIYYGPPGTGKTYVTKKAAADIISDDNKPYEDFVKEGRIGFITFHQSYGYEEFIEGLRARSTPDGQIVYRTENGFFKTFARRALFDYYAASTTWKDKPDWWNKEPAQQKIYRDAFANLPDMVFGIQTSASSDLGYQPKYQLDANVISVVSGLMRYPDKGKSDANGKDTAPRYVIIIDEINRGNISKIFGELITLIEESRRIGARDPLEVTLPYSGEQFAVPPNLYIIGTMNTADRSLAQIDIALRRRFDFVEKMPDINELMKTTINDCSVGDELLNVGKLLEALNSKIESLLDRDHTIGHTYFLPLKDNPTMRKLRSIMEKRVIPLLQEYFYDDWSKIKLILGGSVIEDVPSNDKLINGEKKLRLNPRYKINADQLEVAETYEYILR